MSNNPLSVIDLMETKYDVTIEGDESSGKRCFNELFEIDGDNKINIEKIKSMKHLYELGDSNNRDELMYVENKIKKYVSKVSGVDNATKSHRKYLSYRIDKALET